MNFIPCNSDCIYQKFGECGLERAASFTSDLTQARPKGKNNNSRCCYYVKKLGLNGMGGASGR